MFTASGLLPELVLFAIQEEFALQSLKINKSKSLDRPAKEIIKVELLATSTR